MNAPIALLTLHAGYSHSSLALRSIAAFCQDEPFHAGIRIYEPQVKASLHGVLSELMAQQPRLLGISTYLWNIQASLHLAGLVKQLLPDCHIVLGGPEAGPRAHELLRTQAVIDFIIDGEGEHAFRDLARYLLYANGALDSVSGLRWRDGALIRNNPITTISPEQLPSVLGAGLADLSKPLIYWETSRGCPFKCTFCTSATDRLRMLPMATIEQDLALLAGLHNRTVKLLDRSFHLGRDRTLSLLQKFADTPPSLRFHLELNPDRLSPEAMAIFAAAAPGKFQFEIGLQTLDNTVLQRIDRAMSVDKGLENIRQLVAMRRHPVHLDLIVGLPQEGAEQCRDSLDKTFRLHADHLQLGTLKLLPGTPLLAQAAQYGYRWDEQPPYEILAHDSLSFVEMSRFKQYAELLERLWNSELFNHTLMHLVSHHYNDNISELFDALLAFSDNRLASENMQPDTLFHYLIEFLHRQLQRDPLLGELMAWDYACFTLPSNKSPAWIKHALREQRTILIDNQRKRLPVITPGKEALNIINQRRINTLTPGGYAPWPQKHRRGKPLRLFRIIDAESTQEI